MANIADVQNMSSSVQVALNRVGVRDLELPIFISQKKGGFQHTVAQVDCFVDLPDNLKGINMSRIPIVIHKYLNSPFNSNVMNHIAEEIRGVSEAGLCQLLYRFPFFIPKHAPITKLVGIVPYQIEFDLTKSEDDHQFAFTAGVIATTLCPCSKELCENNAHNQKCLIKVKSFCLKNEWVWIEDVIEAAEQAASCPVFSILKRPDEAHVTTKMYENPAFVEDVTRNLYQRLLEFKGIERFTIEVTSDESIHVHKAYAKLVT